MLYTGRCLTFSHTTDMKFGIILHSHGFLGSQGKLEGRRGGNQIKTLTVTNPNRTTKYKIKLSNKHIMFGIYYDNMFYEEIN